jgi:multidrug efflux pump
MGRREATLEACRLRLRPILMTALAFIFGVYPLVVATGAGWEMRRSLGVAVFSGMIGVTFFGLCLTPVFYYVVTWFTDRPNAGLAHTKTELPSPAAKSDSIQAQTTHCDS